MCFLVRIYKHSLELGSMGSIDTTLLKYSTHLINNTVYACLGLLPHFERFEKIEEREKAVSHQESNPEHLA